MNLSVVIPIYNSKEIISDNLARIVAALDRAWINYEIVFIDDGSQDGSFEELIKLSQLLPKIRVFKNEKNKGLGFTLRELFKKATGDNIIYSDIDLPFGAHVLLELLKQSENYDIVLASRYKGETAKIRIFRRILSRLYFVLCKILFNIEVADLGSGAVLIKSFALSQLSLEANGFDIHAELYAKAKIKGLTVKEFPFPSIANEANTFNIARHGPQVFYKTFRLWLKLK